MEELMNHLTNQLEDVQYKKDAEECIKIYNWIKETDKDCKVWGSRWSPLVDVIFYKGWGVKRHKLNMTGKLVLEGIRSREQSSLNKLIKVYNEHGKIIVGVDFDDTLFPLNEKDIDFHVRLRKLLFDLKPYITLCLYTVSDNQSLKYKEYIMKHCWDLEPDYINCSPVKLGNGDKPFFNILLDDKAGLLQTYTTLKLFKDYIND